MSHFKTTHIRIKTDTLKELTMLKGRSFLEGDNRASYDSVIKKLLGGKR